MEHGKKTPLGLYSIGIAALFLAGFLLLVIFGAQSYTRTAEGQNRNMGFRALNSYLATTVRGYDTKDAVSVREGENGQILVIRDGDTGYALRIYVNDGYLMEDFAMESAELHPEDASPIGKTDTFTIEKLRENVYLFTTDEGKVLVGLRSAEGGARG